MNPILDPILDLGPLAPPVLAAAALGCVVAAAISDLRRFLIPDELSIALLVLALAYGLVTPGFDWVSHIVAPLGFFAIGLVVFARGWMGGGDIKLLTALAAWSGLHGLLPLLVGVALAGGVVALFLLIARRVRAGKPGPRLFERGAPLPYAVAILGGVLWWATIAWPIR